MSNETVNVLPLIAVNDTYTYHVPEEFRHLISTGTFVLIPVRGRKVSGVVISEGTPPPKIELKEIIEILDPKPVITAELLSLSQWIAEYYLSPWGEVVYALLPKGIDRRSVKVVTFYPDRASSLPGLDVDIPALQQLQGIFQKNKTLSFKSFQKLVEKREIETSIPSLIRKGILEIQQSLLAPRVKSQTEEVFRIKSPDVVGDFVENNPKSAQKYKAMLEGLLSFPHGLTRKELKEKTGKLIGSLKSLLKKGLIDVEIREKMRRYPGVYDGTYFKPDKLTDDQQNVFGAIREAISAAQFRPFLLFGVTASGKTQVYIEAIKDVIQQGKSVIFLVPEISLTAHAVMRLNTYFEGKTSFLHSAMSPGERFDAWREIRDGIKQVIIGPRSAIFAPLQNLGLIIVDEEHEETYKQTDAEPRYHARDVAVMRGKLNSCPVILGSATPSMESYYNARSGKFTMLTLPRRVIDTPLPKVKIVNMRKESDKSKIFSGYLQERIGEYLLRKEQVILLRNRRGFSTILQCKDCGFIEQCHHCNISLTFHKKTQKLLCHYCGFNKLVPVTCPNCHGTNLFYSGAGTQKVEEALQELFTEAAITRMDADTTTTRGSHDRIASQFEQGKSQILLGTQMIAKGFDFPNVNLVGVVSADTSLFLPDYRAGERTFQLLTQVAGRAGRREKRGEVVIQTYLPKNRSIQCAVEHNFQQFYESESPVREQLGYPPFGRLIVMVFSGQTEQEVASEANRFATILTEIPHEGKIFGPVPCPLSKLKDKYRWHILVKGEKQKGKSLRTWAAAARDEYHRKHTSKKVTMSIDVDPLSIL